MPSKCFWAFRARFPFLEGKGWGANTFSCRVSEIHWMFSTEKQPPKLVRVQTAPKRDCAVVVVVVVVVVVAVVVVVVVHVDVGVVFTMFLGVV